MSVFAAILLIAVKLGVGIATNSLALFSEAPSPGPISSPRFTFLAGVAARPADEGHEYGHGKAEHLAALAARRSSCS
jgi:divalent metal cation (Fe/Co/Zn/Cd) transporter